MKYLIKKSRLNDIILKWLNDEFGNLTPKTNIKGYDPDIVYFGKDGHFIFDYHRKTKEANFNFLRVWKYIEELFGIDDPEVVNKILIKWLKETYNLKVKDTYTYSDSKGPWKK